MLLDDGGDATHLMVKKYNSIFKVGTFKVIKIINDMKNDIKHN